MTSGGQPHRRFNPLRQEWVLVSPDRDTRPWQGEVGAATPEPAVAYDPNCYLCPGNERAGGARNPAYASTFGFDNDFPALTAPVLDRPASLEHLHASAGTVGSQALEAGDGELLLARPESGICRVVCFSPRHDLTISRMGVPAVRLVVDAWAGEYVSLAARDWVRYVLIFENRGAMMGASNPHPHCQIWATEAVPNEPAREARAFDLHRERRGSCLLCDYSSHEIGLGERIVCHNDAFVAVVPFWATWPFETLVVSRRHVGGLDELSEAERDGLADVLKRLTAQYDRLFDAPFPYSMGVHQRPLGGRNWHLHAHYYPPLLRSAGIRKFMVGFELFGSPQRDLTPERAAARLREVARH